MLTTEQHIQQLEKRENQIKEALANLMVALNHDDYNKKFEFKAAKNPHTDAFTNQTMKNLIEKCNQAEVGLDFSLLVQHVEKVALERFNKIVLDEISNKSIRELMTIRHESELFMLKDNFAHYQTQLAEIEKTITEVKLAAAGLPVAEAKEEKVVKLEKKNKKK